MKTFLALLAITAVSVGLIAVALLGDRPGGQQPPDATGVTLPPQVPADLAGLVISEPSYSGNYDRDAFGQAWSDDVSVAGGHNGCDTRNDILRRDLVNPKIRPGTYDCLVESGELVDPYTGQHMQFFRGDRQVEIDHIVALADAWRSGASTWSPERRRDFANDPRNLLATGAQINQDKGADSASEWLPPATDYRCDYVRARVDVKRAYGLSVSQAEYDVSAAVLAACDD